MFEHDPHRIADKLTAYWKSQGFIVTRTIDWTTPDGWQSVELRADRPDGVQYGLTATNDLVAIDAATECSTHPSIDDWAAQGVQKRLESLFPTPHATPSATPHEGSAGTGHNTMAAAIDPTNPFRQFLEEESAPPEDAPDHSDLFRRFREDQSADAGPDDDGWVW
ncbi:hypothetical protein ACRAWB_07560 [Leifsonia poae]|uniref:hypothetical protein n=1 Tax=Leifsonia poae TaxID=110933 RepID=UPI003D6957C0